MSRNVQVVSSPVKDPRLPDRLAPAALFLERAEADGVLARCEEAFVMGRRNGHTGGGLSVFLLVYLLVQPSKGLRPFAEQFAGGLERLARLVGLRSLPSAAAVSRALQRLQPHHAATFCDGILTSIPGLLEALQQPDVLHRDEAGQGWHVLDVDPTVKAFRQRHLQSDEDCPTPDRLSPGCPGYTGQKRGELRIRSVPVAHAGLGCWLAYRMWEENPHVSLALGEVIDRAVGVMRRAGAAPHQVIIRMDGEFGNAGCMHRVRATGAHLVTRLSRYGLLDRSEVAPALEAARWQPVRGDRPKEAADLGLFTLHPAAKSADAGGPPVTVRVVVSRRPARDRESHGVLLGPYVYELFATTLEPSLWSAPSIVELYLGRASMENLLAQEDRELGLDRTFSYSASGQALAVSLGLMLWNYLTILGGPKPASEPELPDAPSSESWIETALEAPVEEPVAVPEQPEQESESEVEAFSPPTEPGFEPFPTASPRDKRMLARIVARSYPDLLRARWMLDTETATLTCPNGKPAFPFSVARAGPGRPKPQVIVRTETSACNGCPLRDGCFSSNRPDIPKQIARAVEPAEAEWIRSFLREHPPQRRSFLARRPSKPAKKRVARCRNTPNRPLFRSLSPSPPSTKTIERPPAVPGERRCRARRLLARVRSAEIRLAHEKSRRPTAHSDPRHRRRTWGIRRARWRAPRPVRVLFQVAPNLAGTKSCPVVCLLGAL